ncbi:hypothetical protein [Fusibacter sp. 3D3]|uniref:hypothetical protein n=1 Tax=Fusibacter sp. 3D3 TaxID=1048380 RepID=UPI000853CC87|nr:hypothetical protein [Fusibacter sp. 3D3]GAU78674.1 hypothetical protein F3D3_3309 [Fusibacter sp. 3D3]
MLINRNYYEKLTYIKPDSDEMCNSYDNVTNDVDALTSESSIILKNQINEYTSTWLLDKDLWIQHENSKLNVEFETLSRGRIVLVNPGVTKLGREQRFMHYYIILGEFKETFIGVPITNMAYDKNRSRNYLRNFFEVELIDPIYPKPYNEYRCTKRSVADVRNISGLDKRRIVKNQLYTDKKFAPSTYLNSVSEKIRESIASIV